MTSTIMANSKSKFPIKEWEDSLNGMSLGELQKIVEDPGIYYPSFLDLAKKKIDELSSIPEHEAMRDMVMKCLKELGCPCEIDEDGDIDFHFQGELFNISLGEDHHYIEILDYCWKKVSLDDTEEVKRLKHAVNYANSNCTVTTVYFTDDENICVYCKTSILYQPMISNLKDYLDIRLRNFFLAHNLVNSEMTLMAERDKKKMEELDLLNIDKLSIS